jgi:murein DD-endopeptidase MepM/ murein hydrolase activator NlpD
MHHHAISQRPRATRNSGRRAGVSPRAIAGFALVAGLAGWVGSARAFDEISVAGEVTATAQRIVPKLVFPIDPEPRCIVANNFGGDSKVFGSTGHQGVDIGADLGQEVYAVQDGFLYRRFEGGSSGLGWGLWSVTDVKYRYFHLSAFADGLEEGDPVVAGQLIGYVGDTGNATPGGYHLHFEVRPGPQPQYGSATPVDPVPLLDIPSSCTVYPHQ